MQWIKKIKRFGQGVLRIECYSEGTPEPQATFAVRNPECFKRVSLRDTGEGELYSDKVLSIRILQDSKPFSPRNLIVSWETDGKKYTWKPGWKDNENLGGSFMALDLCMDGLTARGNHDYDPMQGIDSYILSQTMMADIMRDRMQEVLGRYPNYKEWFGEIQRFVSGQKPALLDEWPLDLRQMYQKISKFPPGFLSKSGVTIILDDSLPWDKDKDWLAPRVTPEPQILYIYYYGHDYKKGLLLYSRIFGRIPLVPEWIMGTWFSCYREMGHKDYVALKKDFDKHNLPLDMVVVDTDWHKYWWHGFDWNKRLFPDPPKFTEWLTKNKLHAAFNVHPQYIPRKDSRLPEFFKRTGFPEFYLSKETAPHPFHADCYPVDLYDKKQAAAYFDVFHKPIEDNGCDIWWIDGILKDDRGRPTTTWLNESYFMMTNRRNKQKKRVVFSRTYGLGSHRSSIAFTGDTCCHWKVLEQEVVMTQKGANCLLAYMSHDIGAFLGGSPEWKENKPPDELYTRWVQFGSFSPIMRFHSDHGIREPWRFTTTTLEIVRLFLLFRECLKPYLMKLVQEAHESGVSLCRPMYYEYPELDESYSFECQYMLGSEMLVSPVVREDSWVETWLPPGIWHHCFVHRIITGPTIIRERCPIDNIPVYIRDGGSVPCVRRKMLKGKSRTVYNFQPGEEPFAYYLGLY